MLWGLLIILHTELAINMSAKGATNAREYRTNSCTTIIINMHCFISLIIALYPKIFNTVSLFISTLKL